MNYRTIKRVLPYGANPTKIITDSTGANPNTVNVAFGDWLVYQFPRGIIDLSTLWFAFNYTRAGVPSTDLLPKDIECIFDQITVSLGDTVLNDITNHSQLFFVHSTYGQSAEWNLQGANSARTWMNRRLFNPLTNIQNTTFAADTFLGFLGSKKIIDTRKHPLVVRIKLGPLSLVTTNTIVNNAGLRNPYFRVHYLEESKANLSATRFTFDDYTSVRMPFPTYDGDTKIIVDGKRKLDYVIARCLNTSAVDTRFQAMEPTIFVTQNFVSNAENIGSYEFMINNRPAHEYKCPSEESMMAIRDVFPDGVIGIDGNSASTQTTTFNRAWATGIVLDLPQSENSEQYEIRFVTTATGSGLTTPHYAYVWVKSTSTLDMSDGKLVLTV